MIKRFKFRFYPSETQKALLTKTFGSCRFVYNWGISHRKESFEKGEKPNFLKASKALTSLKVEKEWLKEISSVALQQEVRKLDIAYKNFFKKRSGYPKFKKKVGNQGFGLTKSGIRWSPGNLSIAKIGRLAVKWSRHPKSCPSSVTIIKSASGKYFVSMVVDETVQSFPKTGKQVGIDLGLNDYATLSDGRKFKGLKGLKVFERKLAKEQRKLSRKKKGSRRREKQKIRVARVYEKIANVRKDFLDKLSTSLVKEFDIVAIEDLNISGMMKNQKLARSIARESFRMFRSMLEYKTDWYGKKLKVCGRFFPSSKLCGDCGWKNKDLKLGISEWKCLECGQVHDRDMNAAVNILAAGRVVTARGEDVRPAKLCVRRRTLLKREPLIEPAFAG